MGNYKYLLYERKGDIATITLNRPEKLNVLTIVGREEDYREFFAAFDEAEADDDVKVVILKGAGRAFSAGEDLTRVGKVYGWQDGKPGEPPKRPSQRVRLKIDRWGMEDMVKLLTYPKFWITQIHGYCLEGGLYFALFSDYAIAEENTVMAFRATRLGFAGSNVSIMPLLIYSIGYKRALDLAVVTGREFDAKYAEQIGLINRAVPADQLEDEVQKVAKAITLYPKDGLRIGKAWKEMVLYNMGIPGTIMANGPIHSLYTNIKYDADEWNFFKDRRDRGIKGAFDGRDSRFTKAGLK